MAEDKIPKIVTLRLTPWQFGNVRAMLGAHEIHSLAEGERGLHLRSVVLQLPTDLQEHWQYSENDDTLAPDWDHQCYGERVEITIKGRGLIRYLREIVQDYATGGKMPQRVWELHFRDLCEQLKIVLPDVNEDDDEEDALVPSAVPQPPGPGATTHG